jgi:hypothetical protein
VMQKLILNLLLHNERVFLPYCVSHSAVKRSGNLLGIYVSFLVTGGQTENSTLVRFVSRDAKINSKFAFTQWEFFLSYRVSHSARKTLWYTLGSICFNFSLT